MLIAGTSVWWTVVCSRLTRAGCGSFSCRLAWPQIVWRCPDQAGLPACKASERLPEEISEIGRDALLRVQAAQQRGPTINILD
jgi:hypothetical protein